MYQNLVLRACSKFISTPKRYQFNNNNLYNWHCKIDSNKDNFRTLSSQGLFENIVINLLSESVILGFSTLGGSRKCRSIHLAALQLGCALLRFPSLQATAILSWLKPAAHAPKLETVNLQKLKGM